MTPGLQSVYSTNMAPFASSRSNSITGSEAQHNPSSPPDKPLPTLPGYMSMTRVEEETGGTYITHFRDKGDPENDYVLPHDELKPQEASQLNNYE